jgi:hypothetical protein
MKKIIILGLLVHLISCSENQETFERKENKEEEKVSNLKIQTHESFEIDSSGIVIFPLQIGETDDSRLKGSFESGKRDAYWNMIFYNTNTGKKHWLSDKKMLILNYETNYDNSSYYSSEDSDTPKIDNYSSKNYILELPTGEKIKFEAKKYLRQYISILNSNLEKSNKINLQKLIKNKENKNYKIESNDNIKLIKNINI